MVLHDVLPVEAHVLHACLPDVVSCRLVCLPVLLSAVHVQGVHMLLLLPVGKVKHLRDAEGGSVRARTLRSYVAPSKCWWMFCLMVWLNVGEYTAVCVVVVGCSCRGGTGKGERAVD